VLEGLVQGAATNNRINLLLVIDLLDLLGAMNSKRLESSLEVEAETRKVYHWLDSVREHQVHYKGQL
jgi:hypothetical protein